MKTIKQSSLFFYVIVSFFFSINDVYTQQPLDSSYYYYDLISKPKNIDDLFSAYVFFDKYKKKDLKDGDTLSAIRNLRYIAAIQKKIGLLNDSEKSGVDALSLLDKINENNEVKKEPKIGLYNHLGKVYRELENYDDAIKYYKKAEKIDDKLENQIIIKNNIGIAYLKQKKYNQAISYFSHALKRSIEINDREEVARIRSNLGLSQSKLNIKEGLMNLELALEFREKMKLNDGIITSYLHLVEYYMDRGKKDKAVMFAMKAYNVAKITKNRTHELAVLNMLTNLSEDENVLKYKKINDSITYSRRQHENKNSSIRYRLNEQIETNNQIELEKEKIKNENQLSYFLLFLIILISIFSYFIIKSKHKKKTLQAVYKTESHISKKVHDEVANDVFQVMNTLQNTVNVNERIIDDLDAIYIKTRNISKEHSVLDYEGNFKETLNDLLLNYNTDAVRVIVKDIDKVNWEIVSKLKKETIYKVLQELMVNMKKHSQAEFVALTFKTLRKKITISYSDDGIGTDIKKSTGLQNVENRIRSINGTINFESGINKGFKSKITV